MAGDYSQIQNVLASIMPQYAQNQGSSWTRSVMVRNGEDLAGGEIRVTARSIMVHPRLAATDIVGCCERMLTVARDFDEAQVLAAEERYDRGVDHLDEAIRILGEDQVIQLLNQQRNEYPAEPDPDFGRDELP